jgi:hypothetical protein
MRSLEVRLLPGSHKIDVAIAYNGSWSLPFRKGRNISFEAVPGKSYELQFYFTAVPQELEKKGWKFSADLPHGR